MSLIYLKAENNEPLHRYLNLILVHSFGVHLDRQRVCGGADSLLSEAHGLYDIGIISCRLDHVRYHLVKERVQVLNYGRSMDQAHRPLGACGCLRRADLLVFPSK